MFKKTLATAVLLCTVPAVASAAWFLTTRAMNVGGTIASDNMTAQVVTDGVITKSYNSSSPGPITVTPAAGNNVRSVVLTASGVNALGNYSTSVTGISSPYTLTPADGYTYTVAATFQAETLTVTAGNNGGTASPSSVGGVFYGYTLRSPVTFTFLPAPGYTITGISGTPSQATVSVPGIANKRATVMLPAGYVFTSSLDLEASAVNNTPMINHISPQTVLEGSNVTLTATGSNVSGTYNWTYVSGPANTATLNTNASGQLSSATGSAYGIIPGPAISAFPAAGPTVSFTAPGAPGQYKFVVTNGTLTSLATVNVVASFGDAANQCQFCHTANNVGSPTIGADWASSDHQANGVLCARCHVGTDSGGHPGPYVSSANSCEVCHSGAPTQNFLQSAHWLSKIGSSTGNDDVMTIEGPNGPDLGGWTPDCVNSCHFKSTANKQEGCSACHNPHRPETGLPSDANANAIFYAYSTLPSPAATTSNTLDGASESLQNGYFRHDTGCFKCHHQGNGEGNAPNIYDNDDFPIGPHFDTTSDNSGVAFMNAGNTCANCHGHDTLAAGQYGGFNLYNAAGDSPTSGYNVQAWTVSGHANVNSAAWAEGGGGSPCVRCHTTQGFINYSSFHVVTPITASKSVLGCNGCHTNPDMTYSPFGNLTTVNGAVGTIRKIAAYPATYASGTARASFQFPDAGPSNICVPCHSGRINGAVIKQLATTSTLSSFQNPHYAAAAGILYKSLGYEFDGQNYDNPSYFMHDRIGMKHFAAEDGSDTGIVGPCASCHYMAGPGHTLHVFSRYTATSGPNAVLLGQVSTVNSTLCANCHSGTRLMDANGANENINGFQAALGALQNLLQDDGVYYNPNVYGYFFTDSNYVTKFTNWSIGGTNSANNMGAAFNLHLLTKEPGAYAHNRLYTKRLIFDSIDWLQNGRLTGGINVGDITNYTGFDADAAANYLGAARP